MRKLFIFVLNKVFHNIWNGLLLQFKYKYGLLEFLAPVTGSQGCNFSLAYNDVEHHVFFKFLTTNVYLRGPGLDAVLVKKLCRVLSL